MSRILVWHECRLGNNFGSYADQNVRCPDCGITEVMPTVRNIYTKETPLEMCEITRVDRDTFPMLVGYETPIVRGAQ
jgi:hypothetical protein